jgi:ribosomal protein L36
MINKSHWFKQISENKSNTRLKNLNKQSKKLFPLFQNSPEFFFDCDIKYSKSLVKPSKFNIKNFVITKEIILRKGRPLIYCEKRLNYNSKQWVLSCGYSSFLKISIVEPSNDIYESRETKSSRRKFVKGIKLHGFSDFQIHLSEDYLFAQIK